jgi:hypothetical protein
LKAVKSLRFNKDIRILPADKGKRNEVLDVIEYRHKINTLQNSGVYDPLSKDLTSKVEIKVRQILTKYKAVLPAEVKRKLTP